MIGTRRESVTLALSSLERDGLIRGEGRNIVVADVDGLRDAADM